VTKVAIIIVAVAIAIAVLASVLRDDPPTNSDNARGPVHADTELTLR